jgi:hypothetical protein
MIAIATAFFRMMLRAIPMPVFHGTHRVQRD